MGEGNGVASVIIMLTFTVRPGPHADTAWAVVGQLAQLKLWFACSGELMSCVGRLCKDYLFDTLLAARFEKNPSSLNLTGKQLTSMIESLCKT